MNQEKVTEIKSKMVQALNLIKEALNISLPLLKGEQKDGVIALWEAFLREVINYVKKKSKESGSNLMAYISLRRIWLR